MPRPRVRHIFVSFSASGFFEGILGGGGVEVAPGGGDAQDGGEILAALEDGEPGGTPRTSACEWAISDSCF